MVCLTLCLVSAVERLNPYAGPHAADFWEDIQMLHTVVGRARVPRYHGGSRPFFESITSALSEAEKSAFSRLSQGILPDSGLSVDDTPPPTNVPLYYKTCDSPEVEGLGTSLMQLDTMSVSLDPRHIKMRVDIEGNLRESLSSNLVHHTVVTVDDVSVAGFEMSPMVLYDKTGSVCDMFDSVLGCPLNKGTMHIAKKVKIPGLDAVTSLPRRLYNAQVKLLEGDALVSCMHLFLDLRSEEERKAKPLTGVTESNLPAAKASTPVPASAPTTESGAIPQKTIETSEIHATQAEPSVEETHDGSSATLGLLRSVINLQKEAAASKPKTPQQQEENALLQQLQLKNLQEQLQAQLDINKKQQMEYEDLKKKLQRLEPSEIDHLKSTVNELLAIQKVETEERTREEQHAARERELYRQLQHMYENYGLPTSGLPFLAPGMMQFAAPRFNPLDRFGDIQFLSQIDKNLETEPLHSVAEAPSPTLTRRAPASEPKEPVTVAAPVVDQVKETKAADVPTTQTPAAETPKAPAALSASATSSESQQITEEPAAQTAGKHAGNAEPLQYPNPNNPTAKYGDGVNGDPNVKPVATEAPANPVVEENVEKMKARLPALYQVQDDKDLPDVLNVLASSPTFSDNDYGVSYTMTKLDDYVKELCVPFVTLASDLSFSFCMPPNWQGLTAIVISEPFTAEKGIFADKTSMNQPHSQVSAPDTSDKEYYALPKFVGMNEILLKHNYATVVVSFNADNFIAGLPYFTTEIMGAFAAFVDYAGEPSMTIVTGVGWGGVLASQLLERHGGCRLHGGLVIDSPLGNARWQGDYYGDILTLFQWVSPKAYSTIMRTSSGGATHLLLESWEEIGRPYVYQALTPIMSADGIGAAGNYVNASFDSPRDMKMLEMLHALSLNCDFTPSSDFTGHPHPQCLHNELASAIRKAALYMLSFRLAFDGQDPYDNYRTLYLPEMFPHLNEEVSRKIADEAALNHQSRYLETSGLLKVPLALMTTKKDPEVPDWQAVEYLRKQKQMCESDGIASRVINDTETHYFGHGHTDQAGSTLSTQLDILYSVISMTRRVDDTSLSQRSWMPQPMRMVDADLASCPFQGEWYRDMDDALKKSVKSGTLRTNNKISELLTGVVAPEALDFDKVAPNPGAVANATAANVNSAVSKVGDAAAQAPAISSAAVSSVEKASESVGETLNSTAGAAGGAASGAEKTASTATSAGSEAASKVRPSEIKRQLGRALTPRQH